MTNPEKIKRILLSEIEKMNQHREDFYRHPGIDFTRNRKISFDTLLHFQISMRVAPSTMNCSSISKALLQLQQLLSSPIPVKRQVPLLACDGSAFTFTRNPKDTESYYKPSGRSQKGFNQMYLVPLYDLLNKVYTDAVIKPIRKRNEFAALYELIDRHVPCSGTVPVFIADRGFHAYNVFAHAIENGSFFVIRATDTKMERLLSGDLSKEETFDTRVTRYLTRSCSKKKYLYLELADKYCHICQKVAFDYFPEQGYGEYEISLRALRFPIRKGIYENIITNVPENEFHAEEIKEIYHLR